MKHDSSLPKTISLGEAECQAPSQGNLCQSNYGYFRPIIKDVVEKYLDCGNPPSPIFEQVALTRPPSS